MARLLRRCAPRANRLLVRREAVGHFQLFLVVRGPPSAMRAYAAPIRVTIVLLVICTSAYLHRKVGPYKYGDEQTKGFAGVFWCALACAFFELTRHVAQEGGADRRAAQPVGVCCVHAHGIAHCVYKSMTAPYCLCTLYLDRGPHFQSGAGARRGPIVTIYS